MSSSPAPRLVARLQEIVDVVFSGNNAAAAASLDIPAPSLHRILSGQIEAPRMTTLTTLASNLGLSVGWLIGEVPDEQEFGRMHKSRALIAKFNGARRAKLQRHLTAFMPKTARGRKLVSGFRSFDLTDEPPIPAHDILFDESVDPRPDELDVMRKLGDLEADILRTAIEQIQVIEQSNKSAMH